jgi:hypothetical protein
MPRRDRIPGPVPCHANPIAYDDGQLPFLPGFSGESSMRSAILFGLVVFLLAGLIGCGGSSAKALFDEEQAWEKDRASTNADPKVLADRKLEWDRKFANLTTAEKEEYTEMKKKANPRPEVPAGKKGSGPK